MNQFVRGILLALLLTALLLPPTEAAVMHGVFKHPDYPGKCYLSPTVILSVGEKAKYPDMECAKFICEGNSMGVIHTCGVISPPPGFVLGNAIYPDADYPKCCERAFLPVEDCAAKHISSI